MRPSEGEGVPPFPAGFPSPKLVDITAVAGRCIGTGSRRHGFNPFRTFATPAALEACGDGDSVLRQVLREACYAAGRHGCPEGRPRDYQPRAFEFVATEAEGTGGLPRCSRWLVVIDFDARRVPFTVLALPEEREQLAQWRP
ncbi:MAG TPA: hypothetical protein PKJ99_12205 [Thermoanaerobaculales bacterium]|nr:hypothetical protein [Thermoanaerobaculales bacterium]HQL30858.1 hypothetical protein [Thermoanaerobaculales bacterium]